MYQICSFLNIIEIKAIFVWRIKNTTIKKTIAILLIGLLGFNTSGVSLFYCAEIALCKIKAKEEDNIRMEKSRAIVFSSKTGGFKLVDDDELMAGGKMYDIVARETANGVTRYYAARDDDEDDLLNRQAIFEKSSPTDKSLASARLKVYDVVYCLVKIKNRPVLTFLQLNAVNRFNSPAFYQSYFRAIISPPPQYLPA